MITASKVALAASCEGSFALPQHDHANPYQAAGSERHAELESLVSAGGIPPEIGARWPGYTWQPEVAFALDLATGKGWEIGVGINRGYPTDAGDLTICGTADLIGRGPAGELVVVEKKSFDPSIARAAVNAQLHTCALMACRAYGVDECDVALIHEARALDVESLDLFRLEEFHVELRGILERAAAARKKVRDGLALDLKAGSWCRWCSAFSSCDLQRDLALDVQSGSADMRVAGLIPLTTDEQAANAYEFLKRVKMLSKRLSDALYMRASERPIPIGENLWYGKHTKNGNTKIDADIAYQTIRELHGQEAADAAVTRSATQAGIKRALGDPKKAMALIKERGGTSRETKESVEEFSHQLKAVNDG